MQSARAAAYVGASWLANEGEKVCWWVGSGSWWREEMVKLVVVTVLPWMFLSMSYCDNVVCINCRTGDSQRRERDGLSKFFFLSLSLNVFHSFFSCFSSSFSFFLFFYFFYFPSPVKLSLFILPFFFFFSLSLSSQTFSHLLLSLPPHYYPLMALRRGKNFMYYRFSH